MCAVNSFISMVTYTAMHECLIKRRSIRISHRGGAEPRATLMDVKASSHKFDIILDGMSGKMGMIW